MNETPVAGLSSMATRELLAAAAGLWRERSGRRAAFESAGGVDVFERVLAGERADVVVLAADAIERLGAAGRLVPGSSVPLARSEVAIAVRQGAAKPAVHSEDALRQALLAARSIGHSTGPSGTALRRLFARWGLGEALEGRLVQARPGTPVGELIARGDVEIGFQQLSELMHLGGIELLGPMPPGLEIVTVFSGAVCAASMQPEAGRELLGFIASPAADELRRRHGMRSFDAEVSR